VLGYVVVVNADQVPETPHTYLVSIFSVGNGLFIMFNEESMHEQSTTEIKAKYIIYMYICMRGIFKIFNKYLFFG
jgi:hypothetical protein